MCAKEAATKDIRKTCCSVGVAPSNHKMNLMEVNENGFTTIRNP